MDAARETYVAIPPTHTLAVGRRYFRDLLCRSLTCGKTPEQVEQENHQQRRLEKKRSRGAGYVSSGCPLTGAFA